MIENVFDHAVLWALMASGRGREGGWEKSTLERPLSINVFRDNPVIPGVKSLPQVLASVKVVNPTNFSG